MLAHIRSRRLGVGQPRLELVGLDLQLRRLRGECVLLDRAGQVAVEQALLHLLQLAEPLAGHAVLLFADARLIVARDGQVPAEPVAAFVVRDAEGCEVVPDGLFELIFPPADDRMVGAGFEVATAVVDVLVDAAALHPAYDSFAGDSEAAVGANEQATGQVVIGLAGPAVLSAQQVLAALEHLHVDERLVPAGIGLAGSHHADPAKRGLSGKQPGGGVVTDVRVSETR